MFACERFVGVAVVVSIAACASAQAPGASAPARPGAGASSTPTLAPTSTPKAARDSIPIDGDPNGLFWNDATQTLLASDEQKNRVLAWTEATGWSTLGELPPSPAKAGLGQPVQLANGTIVVPRFGFGTDGGVVLLRPDGTSSLVPHLDKARRRIGLAVAPDGTLYDSYFVKGEPHLGGVARIDPNAGEVDIVTDLKKPVGVLATRSGLLVADQDSGALIAVSLPAKTESVFASTTTLDLVCAGPDGSLFTGGRDGAVRLIDANGKVTFFATGFDEIRGVAYDAKGRRLFFVNHVPSGESALLVRPVP